MSFNSVVFLLFFAAGGLLYYAAPSKIRIPCLLFLNYVFYAYAGIKLTLYLLLCTVFSYVAGRLIYRFRNDGKKASFITAAAIILDAGVLAVFKYTNFVLNTARGIAGHFGITLAERSFPLAVPLGISFITFQTISYMADVRKGKTAPETGFLKYAAFVSFFPIVVQGPIEKSYNIIPQFEKEIRFEPLRI